VLRDLFDDDNSGWLTDAALVNKLASEKLDLPGDGLFRGLSDQPNAGCLRSLPSLDYVDGYALAIGDAGDPRAVQR
jgi:hypothetical protein